MLPSVPALERTGDAGGHHLGMPGKVLQEYLAISNKIAPVTQNLDISAILQNNWQLPSIRCGRRNTMQAMKGLTNADNINTKYFIAKVSVCHNNTARLNCSGVSRSRFTVH